MKIFGLAKKPAPRTLKPTLSNVDLKADVTGVPTGGYDITLGTYGHFTGTQKIVRQRFATVKVKDTDDLKATVAAMLKDALGGADVTVTKASARISTHETKGGVQAIFSGKITYVATVTSGADTGATVKGRMTASGKF